MIELKQLEIGYRQKKQTASVFKGLNALFSAGDMVGLMGNNGVGKSTLLKTMTGNLKALSGEVVLDKNNIDTYSSSELAKYLSIVVTEKIGGFNLTVWDVVASGRIPYINVFGKLTKEDEHIITECLEQLNLMPLKDKFVDELSDGQRQKVMIAKSLSQQTPVIILDEPTAFLDYNSKHQLFKVLKELCEIKQKLIIVSSHDLDLMKPYINRSMTLMEDNRVELI
ncbi:MAG: ABC transporter ATP-binding protein [Bacteroidota bacterium]